MMPVSVSPFELHTYAGAHHDFDYPGIKLHEEPGYRTTSGVVPNRWNRPGGAGRRPGAGSSVSRSLSVRLRRTSLRPEPDASPSESATQGDRCFIRPPAGGAFHCAVVMKMDRAHAAGHVADTGRVMAFGAQRIEHR